MMGHAQADHAEVRRLRRQQRNYHHIHRIDKLPRKYRGDDRNVFHGYVVRLSGNIGKILAFFHHLEPALVFGRSGRMAATGFGSYDVHEAAIENRFDHDASTDVRALYILNSPRLDRTDDEREHLQRWLEGVAPKSSHFNPTLIQQQR